MENCKTCKGRGYLLEEGEVFFARVPDDDDGVNFLPPGTVIVGRPSTSAGTYHACHAAPKCPDCEPPPSQRITPVSSFPPANDLEAAAVATCKASGMHNKIQDKDGYCTACHNLTFEE